MLQAKFICHFFLQLIYFLIKNIDRIASRIDFIHWLTPISQNRTYLHEYLIFQEEQDE